MVFGWGFVVCQKYFSNNYSDGKEFFFLQLGVVATRYRGEGGKALCFLSLPPVEWFSTFPNFIRFPYL